MVNRGFCCFLKLDQYVNKNRLTLSNTCKQLLFLEFLRILKNKYQLDIKFKI